MRCWPICRAVAVIALAGGTAGFAASPTLIQSIAGVYKHRFANADVQGDQYTSEDILEIVPVSPTAAYFRLHTEFYNGHECNISGVTEQQSKVLIYQGPHDFSGHPCRLTLAPSAAGVSIYEDENGACRAQTCGARGGYGYQDGKPEFTAQSRRPIRYMKRLLASQEYRDALAAYRNSSSAGPASR